MSRLVETIKIVDGIPQNLSFHNERMSFSLFDLYGIKDPPAIEDFLQIPPEAARGVWKCRVLYDRAVTGIQYAPYKIMKVNSLKIIEAGTVSYRHKFTDRSELAELSAGKQDCDDILIIKNGLVTDTSYSNVIFKTRDGRWVTPFSYLLPGTMRASLLHSGEITEEQISLKDLGRYESFKLINSMLSPDETGEISISNLKW